MTPRETIWKRTAGFWAVAAASLLIGAAGTSTCPAQTAKAVAASQTSAAKPDGTTAAPNSAAPNTAAPNTAAPRHRARRHAKPNAPQSASSQTANPPQVTLNNGKLMVDAHNSELSAILQDVSQKSGMSVDGLSRNSRVFGVYGPGSPQDVLSELLTGAGYNFVMVGGGAGIVPRELVLTAQNGNALPLNPVKAGQPQSASNGSENSDSGENGQQPLGPGAIAHPSPQDTDQTDPQTRMQRHLDTLRRMQETFQQQQQQQQSQPNSPNQPQ